MLQIILVVHLLVALSIIGLIMLQQGKGADMGASFGAGASQTLFGSSGSANVLTRTTAWLVLVFFATSFSLAVIANNASRPADDLGIEIPASELQSSEDAAGSEVPAVEQGAPEVSGAAGDVPAGDVPEVPAGDVPEVPQQ